MEYNSLKRPTYLVGDNISSEKVRGFFMEKLRRPWLKHLQRLMNPRHCQITCFMCDHSVSCWSILSSMTTLTYKKYVSVSCCLSIFPISLQSICFLQTCLAMKVWQLNPSFRPNKVEKPVDVYSIWPSMYGISSFTYMFGISLEQPIIDVCSEHLNFEMMGPV